MPPTVPPNANPNPAQLPNMNPVAGNNPQEKRPPLDLKAGRAQLIGTWETQGYDQRTRKPTVITTRFDASGSYTMSNEVEGKALQERVGDWAMDIKGESYVVSVASAPAKDGKATGRKAPLLFLLRFDGNDKLLVVPAQGGAPQSFTRKQ